MRGAIETGFLVGLGALTLTREKVQSLVDELVKKGQTRRGKTEDLVDRLVARGEEERVELRKLIQTEVERVVAGMNLATRKDVRGLAGKIDALTRKLEGNSSGAENA